MTQQPPPSRRCASPRHCSFNEAGARTLWTAQLIDGTTAATAELQWDCSDDAADTVCWVDDDDFVLPLQ
jgi:hypothetical protein